MLRTQALAQSISGKLSACSSAQKLQETTTIQICASLAHLPVQYLGQPYCMLQARDTQHEQPPVSKGSQILHCCQNSFPKCFKRPFKQHLVAKMLAGHSPDTWGNSLWGMMSNICPTRTDKCPASDVRRDAHRSVSSKPNQLTLNLETQSITVRNFSLHSLFVSFLEHFTLKGVIILPRKSQTFL